MGFALKMIGVSKAEVDRKVRAAANILQIGELLERKPRQLSGGQRQRVAIGRAITRSPDVFLFDEPLSNLDADLRAQMRVEIARLHDELRTTMIYVTHDQVEAMTLADRIVILNNGQVEQEGPPLELYEKPANRFVAGFLGQPKMNFLLGDRRAGQWTDRLPARCGRTGDRLPAGLGGHRRGRPRRTRHPARRHLARRQRRACRRASFWSSAWAGRACCTRASRASAIS